MGLFNRKKKVAGLDIGDHSIKFAEIKKVGHGYELVQFAILPTPQEAKAGESIADHLSLAPALNKLMDMYKRKLPKVALALSGNSVLIRHFILPPMPEDEMAEAVKFEVEANLPIPISELVVDFIKVGEVEEGALKRIEVMVVAVRKEIVNRFAQTVSTTGLEPVRMDIEPLALLRTLGLCEDIENLGSFAIVNIGSNSTNISIFENTTLRFSRGIASGGHKISSVLTNRLGLSYEQAAASKEDINVNTVVDFEALSEDNKAAIIRPVLEDLFMEINRTIEFYQAKYRESNIRKMFLCGGSASLKGLADLAASRLAVETKIVNPIDHLTISPKLASQKEQIKAAGSAMAVAIGLALSEVN